MKMNRKILMNLLIISLVAIFLGIFTNEVRAEENEFIYVSDIEYVKNLSSVGWKEITLDKTPDNTALSVKVEGAAYTFNKGIFAHANSTVVYDLTNYSQYRYFTAYVGLNTTSTRGDGVKFDILTSADGSTWESKMENGPLDKLPGQNASFVKIDIRGAKYLKLVANQKTGNASDHSVYADAKLIIDGYDESNGLKSIDEYDEMLKKFDGQDIKENEEYELILLQREFVSRAGEYAIKRFMNEDEANKETIEWLFSDVENIRYYILGGTPSGSYYNSLKQLSRLVKAYRSDFDIDVPLKSGGTRGQLYKRMAVAISLTHSVRVGLWMQTNEYNNSDALVRYDLYKYLYENGKFKKTNSVDITPWFESYSIEELRWVVGTLIDDEEVIWLNEYVQSKIDAAPNNAWGLLTPHSYMAYVWPSYGNPVYYAEENKEYFNQLFSVNGKGLFEYVPYREASKGKVFKLWMNFRNKFGTGAVCGGISKSGHCIRGVNGIASAVIGQPGHAAILYYSRNADGKGYWGIDNDVSGWNYSEKGERMLMGWGNERPIRGTYNIPYIILAQEALNDYDNFEKAEEILFTAKLYKDDTAKQEEIYRKALEVQSINWDAWLGLAKLYLADNTKTEEDFYQLEKEMMEALKCFPFPMYDLSNYIKTKFKSTEYQFKFTLLQERILNEAKNYKGSEVLQPNLTRGFASHLLGQVDTTLATFSFDGDNANKIVLSSRFDGNGVRWDYSIDGKNTWKEIAFDATDEHKWELTPQEISQVNTTDDIYVHIVGANYSEENLYKIDILESAGLPKLLYRNDLENRLVAAVPAMQWKYREEDAWTYYRDTEPDLTGNKTVIVKMGATGVHIEADESTATTFSFTEDNQPETRKYIPVSHLSLESFSSEAAGSGKNGEAINAIDANGKTRWHSAWNGTDKDKFMVIKLDEVKNLTALEYIPAAGGNGKILSAQILVSMDGEEWKEIVESTNWTYANTNDVSMKTVDFEPIRARYIKIVGKNTQTAAAGSSYITSTMFNLYENPTVEIVANFSFDGENGGKIILEDEYKTLSWQYSLDSGVTWKNGEGEAYGLSDKEVKQINENDKIKIRFQGNETQYFINIKKGEIPNITPYVNDWENRLIGLDNKEKYEWKLSDGIEWISYSDEEPVVLGNRTLQVRAKATGIYAASDAIEYEFTEDIEDDTSKYIPISHLSIHGYTSQSIDTARPFYAPNAIDGNINTLWHTDFRVVVPENKAYISVKLDEPKNISAIEFVQRKYKDIDKCFAKNAIIYVSNDGIQWVEAARKENCEQSETLKRIDFEKSAYGQYVKLELETYDMFAAVSLINLYEDTTVKIVGTFSFDENGNANILLNDGYKDSNWEYSLDSGNTWKNGNGEVQKLTDEELTQLNRDDKIIVRFSGNETEYTINVDKMATPTITAYLNDLENRLIGISNVESLEWKIEGDNSWTSYSEKEPIVVGNKKLLVRSKATGIFIASDPVEYQFTEDNQADTRKYVPVSHLSIEDVSAEDKAQKGDAVNAIDGNYNTRWLNSAAATDTRRYITIKFDKPIHLSAMDYVPHSENGKILGAKILGSMDGENFTEIKEVTGWENNQNLKTVDFDESVQVQYVKILGVTMSYTNQAKIHIGARMFNFYKDTTKTEFEEVAPIATISYNITEATKEDVIATVTFNKENVTVKGGNTHTFTENGTYTFEYEDTVGNTGTAVAEVTWIDREAPSGVIVYSKVDPTNQDVIATISFKESNVRITNNDGKNTYTFTDNGEFVFEFADRAGNIGTAKAEVTWIDKSIPKATITYDITKPTNQNVVATISFDKDNVKILNNGGSNTCVFADNGKYEFEFVGPAGNKGTAIAEVTWIDRKVPEALITYSTMNPTNQNVTATVTFDKENVTIINNGGSNEYTFTDNDEFTFEFRGPSGNEGIAIAKVTWIDRTLPVATITYSTKNPTNQNVIATVTFDKEDVTITNNGGSNEYTFTDNGEFEFEFVGPAGNAGVVVAKVNWIDRKVPVPTLKYDKITPTNKSVTATVTFDKEDVTITNNKGSNEYTFNENGEFEFQFVGPSGNRGTIKAVVSWIDTKAPKATIEYDIMKPTSEAVTATISFDKEDVTITNNNGSNEYTFTENGKFVFEFTDKAGNTGTVEAEVTWIDKTIPVVPSFDVNINASKEVLNPGDEFEVSVELCNFKNVGKGLIALSGKFVFEDDKLEIIDISGQNGWDLDKGSFNSENFRFVTDTDGYMLEGGVIFKVKLKVKETVSAPNDITIKMMSIEASNGDIDINADDTELKLSIEAKAEEKLEFSSDKYLIEESFISKVAPETTVNKFMKNVESNRDIILVDKDGKVLESEDLVCTGTIVKVGDELEYTIIVVGDINGDGTVTVTDLAKLKLHLIKKELLTGIEFKAADVKMDKDLTITDLAKIQLHLIKKELLTDI